MIQNNIVQIILGAGPPFSGDQNASLTKVSNDARVLDWSLQATKFLKAEVHFIAGYQIEEIVSCYPELKYTVNPEWSTTGPIISLLEARVDQNSECLVSYGDILFREKTVKELIKLDADVSITVDSKWKERYPNRTLDDINRSEKVIISNGQLLASGRKVSTESANAEFIGLLTIKPAVMKFLRQKLRSSSFDMRRENLSNLLEFIRSNGFNIRVVDVEGDWSELNEPHDLAKFVLGTKAQTLKRLEKIVSKSKIAPQVSFTVAEWGKNSKRIISSIQKKFKSTLVIVRSSAISEDGFDSSNAGAYKSILNIETNDKEGIQSSVANVISSYADTDQDNQVLVQPMIENVCSSGVIFTRTLSESAPYYVINFDDSSQETDTITNGSSNDSKTLIISRYNAAEQIKSFPLGMQGLIPAVQEIESLLDFDALDIEFAIKSGGEVNILQVRPLTSNKYQTYSDDIIFAAINNCKEKFKSMQNNAPFITGKSTIFGVMPDWNPAEIIGTKPFSLSFDLYRYLITDEVWATQRAEYGYRDVRPHPLLVSFSGHPYVDIRASFNSFIPATLDNDLAGRLVDYYILSLRENPHFHDKVEFEVLPNCYAFNFEHWKKILTEGGFSIGEIKKLEEGLKNITQNAISRTQEDLKSVDIFEKRFEYINCSNLSSLDKAITLLEDCRRYGTLAFAHLARSAFVGMTLLKTAVDTKVISQRAMDSFLNSIETVAHEFINDAEKVANNQKSWAEFIERYGHLRPGTYDISTECYSENVEKFLKPIVNQASFDEKKPIEKNNEWFNEREHFFEATNKIGISADLDTIENFLRGAIEGREYAKFIFSRNLSTALELISDYGKTQGLNKDQLANISLGTLLSIKSGKISSDEASTWLENESKNYTDLHQKTKNIELPPLITNENDFNIFMYPSTQPNYVGSGRVTAEIVILSSDNFDHDNYSLDQKILLIPQADPGFDWIFGHNIAGLVTMYGGGNSHMAIRANEFGIRAAIGVGETLYKTLSSVISLELDVTNRKIKVIS